MPDRTPWPRHLRTGALRARTLRIAVAVSGTALLTTALAPATHAATSQTGSQRWSTTAQLKQGSYGGITVKAGAARFTRATGRTRLAGRHYEQAAWTSPWTATGFAADEVIPSWNARTPGRSAVKIRVRVRTTSGKVGSWDTVARWAESDKAVRRASGGAQGDDVARLATDTVRANGSHRIAAWQVRVVLMRPTGGTVKPRLLSAGAVASRSAKAARPTSKTTMTRKVELPVRRYSQMIHRGQYPRYGGGGAAWCSPTATTMVLRSLGKGPKKKQYAWVRRGISQRLVVHGARNTYDHRYRGAGNWPFNAAYAGAHGADAHVTRLTSLRDAEAFVKAGIPLVVSIAFGRGQLSGAPIRSTAGHLVVVRGFTKAGNVIVNDPAAAKPSAVRRVYKRAQLERAWVRGSGGVAYVIRTGKSLPRLPGHRW